MKIATWNVNSIKARHQHLLDWLPAFDPDVVVLQEIKCVDEAFPALEVQALGYHVAVHGQKTYNGVAILSKTPIEITQRGLPGDPGDEQARYLEGLSAGLRIGAIYLPNGNPIDTEKFGYKLAWMERLYGHVQTLLASETPFALGGDYNIAPADGDVYDPESWADDALCHPKSRAVWRKIMYLGLTEAYRSLTPEIGRYSWWDYRGGAWNKDQGARIDHWLLSPQAADKLRGAGIDRTPRGWEKASDHTPVWCDLDL